MSMAHVTDECPTTTYSVQMKINVATFTPDGSPTPVLNKRGLERILIFSHFFDIFEKELRRLQLYGCVTSSADFKDERGYPGGINEITFRSGPYPQVRFQPVCFSLDPAACHLILSDDILRIQPLKSVLDRCGRMKAAFALL